MKKSLVFIIFLIIICVGGYIIYREGLMPANPQDKNKKIFVIERGTPISHIVKDLHQEGLIRNRVAFFLLIKQHQIEEKIQAGDFRLSKSMSAQEIATALTKGTLDHWVTIIEGLRKEEIAQILSKQFSIPEGEFTKGAEEGYLFPDTYLIPKDASLEMIYSIFSQNFKKKVSSTLQINAQERGLNLHQMITVASLVERESKRDPDRQIIASILLKRLENDWPLQIDATIQYAIGYQTAQKTWWRQNLTLDDLKIDSPYNTYLYPGLPPGPICNPGLAAIEAVAKADSSTPYWFYISSRDGSTMHYARTQEEHNENIEKYLR